MTQTDVNPGDVLGGKFRIERVLGQGGMGVVVQATHLQLDQRVALKFLLPAALRHPEAVARFAREARAAARIRSEHVARVIDVGNLDDGAPYMVMEYLEGRDLSRLVAESGPLSVSDAARFILQACEALAEAHSLGIVHRDLKPANLFLTNYADGTPCIKILDFGISKLLSADTPEFSLTSTATVMGSPYYMSPEQMRSSKSVDARTDIWALGVILFELVSGKVPFDADTMPALCGRVLAEPPPPLEQFRSGLPREFEAVIVHCLEKDPTVRFQTVAELAQALSAFAPRDSYRSVERARRLSGAPSPSVNSDAVLARSAPVEPPTATDFGKTSRPSGRSLGLWLALGALLLLGGAAAWVLTRRAEVTSAPPPASVVAEAPPQDAEVVSVAPVTPSLLPSAAPSIVPAPSASAEPPSKVGEKRRPRSAATAAAKPAPVTPARPASPSSALDGRL